MSIFKIQTLKPDPPYYASGVFALLHFEVEYSMFDVGCSHSAVPMPLSQIPFTSHVSLKI